MSDYYSFLSQKSRFGLLSMRLTGMPDLFIAFPNKHYKGLFIELKRTGEKVFDRQGLLKSEHVKEQAVILKKLIGFGYAGVMAIGIEMAMEIIKRYMNDQWRQDTNFFIVNELHNNTWSHMIREDREKGNNA